MTRKKERRVSADSFVNAKIRKRPAPKDILAGAIEIAIRDAEIHGTKLAVKTNGKIEELTPKQMRARLKKKAAKTKKT